MQVFECVLVIWSFCFSLKRKRSAVSGVRDKAQKVLDEGEQLLNEANQLSDNINRELEVRQSPGIVFLGGFIFLGFVFVLFFQSRLVVLSAGFGGDGTGARNSGRPAAGESRRPHSRPERRRARVQGALSRGARQTAQ